MYGHDTLVPPDILVHQSKVPFEMETPGVCSVFSFTLLSMQCASPTTYTMY
jgi:hypothetical protein